MYPLVRRGFQQRLEEQDLPDNLPSDDSQFLSDLLEKYGAETIYLLYLVMKSSNVIGHSTPPYFTYTLAKHSLLL